MDNVDNLPQLSTKTEYNMDTKLNFTLSPQHPFYSANDFFRQKLGGKVIKLAIDGGFTCPNRDGTLSSGGCAFCSASGSGDFAGSRLLSVREQIELMKKKMAPKWGCDNIYMAYFQAYTNTYAPVDRLRTLFNEAVECEGIRAVSVATRPDCLDEEKCALLAELGKRVYVCVELGLQTQSDSVAALMNRQYKTEVYAAAVKMLKKHGIDVITHIILGLPTETREDMQGSVDFALSCGTDGLKLQLLHILKGTALADMYRAKPFKVFTLDEYADTIVDITERLPENISVHRITGDGAKSLLIEPWWSLDKRRVLNTISKRFRERNTYQGKKYQSKQLSGQ